MIELRWYVDSWYEYREHGRIFKQADPVLQYRINGGEWIDVPLVVKSIEGKK
jgi:hypothetical protein